MLICLVCGRLRAHAVSEFNCKVNFAELTGAVILSKLNHKQIKGPLTRWGIGNNRIISPVCCVMRPHFQHYSPGLCCAGRRTSFCCSVAVPLTFYRLFAVAGSRCVDEAADDDGHYGTNAGCWVMKHVVCFRVWTSVLNCTPSENRIIIGIRIRNCAFFCVCVCLCYSAGGRPKPEYTRV